MPCTAVDSSQKVVQSAAFSVLTGGLMSQFSLDSKVVPSE